jgi:Glycosyl transferase family 2/Glycosyl transferases group 1
MLFCFVSVRQRNYFMTELLSMISAAVSMAGHDVDFAFNEFPELPDDGVYVVIPHEFHGHVETRAYPSRAQCERTIALCTENPGTQWFEAVCHLAPHFGALMAINQGSVAELRRRGLTCEHLQLGYSPLWDSWGRQEDMPRPIDVLYLGSKDERRDALLAGYGRYLWERSCQLLVPPLDSRGEPGANYLTGIEKHHRLRASKLVLNLHRAESQSFEWVRFLEAACNGCVMLSEQCIDHHPLVPGEHFLVAGADSLPLVAGHLLDDPERLRQVAVQAYDFVHDQLPMDPSVARLATVAAEILRAPTSRTPAAGDAVTPLPLPPAPSPPSPPTAEAQALHRQGVALRALRVQTRELERAVAELAHRAQNGGSSDIDIELCTPSYRDAAPRVSVLVTLHDYEREVLDALSSVAASSFTDFEVLIVDDASGDGSKAAAASFLAAHPWLPAMLLHQPVNRGLGHSRNTLLEHARGEYAFILDADNGIYPPALEQLVAALDADGRATFAYAMIAMYRAGEPAWLLSGLPWDPERLRDGNYIDAMALVRRQPILDLGGYTTDPRLTGWEDFHLWCQCAESGHHGVLVPQVLAWYRRREHSMLFTDTEIDITTAWSVMRARFPDLLGPRTPVAAGGRV